MIEKLIKSLQSQRFPLNNEKETQSEIERKFTEAGLSFTREHRLDGENIIDFLVGDIGIEVKLKGKPKDIYRQLQRYAEFQQVNHIILVTAKSMGLPAEINGKSVYYINISKNWL